MGILILEDDEPQFIWDTIHKLQLVFHPHYAPEGKFNYHELMELKHNKNVIVFFDRNLLSSLLKLCKQGFLNDEREMRVVALLMTWALMNQFPISPGMAIKENAIKVNDSVYAKIELNKFNEIFDFYPSMVWLRLAQAEIDTIPPCKFTSTPYETAIAYHQEDDHLLMHLASMLHIVYLYRREDLSAADKVISFLQWNYKFLLICQYTNTYITLLFTNQEGIRPPKGVNSNNIETVLNGCYNQAWDLNYLSNWSTLYWDETKLKDVFIFATADIMLKQIFINTHGNGNFFDLVDAVFPSKQAQRIINYYEQNICAHNRVRPNFGDNPTQYFYDLIEQEKNRLTELISP